jgi:hypothetical protein
MTSDTEKMRMMSLDSIGKLTFAEKDDVKEEG